MGFPCRFWEIAGGLTITTKRKNMMSEKKVQAVVDKEKHLNPLSAGKKKIAKPEVASAEAITPLKAGKKAETKPIVAVVDNSDEPLSVEVVIRNKHGMHLRCCSEVARLASGFQSAIRISNSRRETDAKSMLGLTTLVAACGTKVKIAAKGPDAKNALTALEQYFSQDSE